MLATYQTIKKAYPDLVLLVKVFDFYQTYDADAKTLAKVCGMTLQQGRGSLMGHTLAGFPCFSLDKYMAELIAAGHRVATVEQTTDANGDVQRIVTPGSMTS